MKDETPLNGSEIANKLGISRQAVSFTLRKSMDKLYHEVRKQGYADTPFDTILVLAIMLGINKGNVKDMEDFIGMFGNDIQLSLRVDASQIYNIEEKYYNRKL